MRPELLKFLKVEKTKFLTIEVVSLNNECSSRQLRVCSKQ